MQNAVMIVELRNRKESGEEYSMHLPLPAADYEIRDVLQMVRAFEDTDELEFVISECPNMPDAEHVRLDAPNLKELNYFAKRLSELTEDEEIVLRAVAPKYFRQFEEDDPISMKDLINLTYGLDEVMIINGISDDTALGQFVMENNLHEDVMAVPIDSRYLLDEKKIGRFQRENNEGVYIGNAYVEIKDYELSEVYDGKNLPTEEEKTDYVFRLEVAKHLPIDEEIDSDNMKILSLELPVNKSDADEIAKRLGEKRIEDCVYLGFNSVIPQITADRFGDMQKFDDLNRLAEVIKGMDLKEEVKFKAVLEAEGFGSIKDMAEAAKNLHSYEFAPKIANAGQYFREYLRSKLDKYLDSAWLDTLTPNKEGVELMMRTGTMPTSYGFVSSKGHRLFEYVTRKDQSIPLDKQFELVSVCDKTALFTNERIKSSQVPDGLYKYELREGTMMPFSSIENSVIVNHGGTVLVKEPIDLGAENMIKYDEESSPNFLGEEVTLKDYLETNYDQTERDENQSIGVIKQ